MSRSKGLSIDECLTLLHQLDEDCTDGSENSDPDFPIPAESEILEESSDSSDSDSAFNENSAQPNVGVSANLQASDGTQCQMMDECSSISGRYASSNVLKELTGPTPYAKRNIGENGASSCRLLFSESIVKHIQKCSSPPIKIRLGRFLGRN
jgi:hypothetical protein